MVLFPNGKINLGLRVTAKRADGYHDIETVFYPILLKEALELTPQSLKHADKAFELVVTGLEVSGEVSNNLCFQAFELIKKEYSIPDSLRMHLHKAIPMGAGLGGGSADGAFALRLLNEALQLNIPQEKLKAYALQLGSDCPFFLLNKPSIATGRGEMLKEIRVNLDEYYFVLVHPGIHISTAWAYEVTTPSNQHPSISEVIAAPVDTWKGQLVNDFEYPVFTKYPALQRLRDELYSAGAAYASLTGTGSCVYGIFNNSIDFRPDSISGDYHVYNLKTHP